MAMVASSVQALVKLAAADKSNQQRKWNLKF